MVSRFLITTADEQTWKFDLPVIFLGEWCCFYDRKHIWQSMDAIIAAPYGLGKKSKDVDHAEARALEEALFPILCEALNQYHGTLHDRRFWRIVLGHWFHRYVDVILNRVRTLELCLRTHQLNGTTVFTDECYALAPQDSYLAIRAFNDPRWNSVLYGRILKLLGATTCPVEIISGDAFEGFRWPAAGPEFNLGQRIFKWGYLHARKLAGQLARENDAFIINSFLPRKEEIKLQLALGQVPQLWASPKLALTENPDRALRQRLSAKIAGAADDSLEGILRTMVFELLPVCYLEGFAGLAESVKQLPWPKKPKFIFTSNNFDMDEVFKLWTAIKVESGYKYITGQHGNNYGTYRYMYPAVEEETADRFLTWGWADGLPQHMPAFIFKTAGRKSEACNPDGGLVLIELHAGLMLSTWDAVAEFKAYFADQQSFVEKLQNLPKVRLTVRLHHGHANLKWGEEGRWKEFDPTVKLDTGASDISKLIAQSRLIVHSYDSTGILETLSQNIPTLAFWQNDLEHLRESAKPYYQLLVDAGIVHFTPESAAAKVNEVWGDVEGWWAQSAVQEARKQFCERYSRVSSCPVRELKKILLSDIS
ncbi:MAG: LIC12162 family protein [Gallionellaceae bacterium]|jgi:putative transferase (TIGR04331 family)